ncbi:hypothetical protein O181_092060 [Austropuccinia psidii MF-1]|uniref:Uncharacterized protein n=1 Tax=Austropuccinia psidii MF-1 TaxID=1389203 RepID=A0A9Q3IXU1_9BASI|nr:hypothetical protein [Austropuccinia psidii MF-1]
MDLTVLQAFNRMALLMKDITLITNHLSNIMTTKKSIDQSACRRQQGKPTACLNAWKHRTPVFKTKKPFRRPTEALPVGEYQERMKHNKYSKTLTELAAYPINNTGSEVCSGNTTVNFSLDSDLSPTCKPNTLEEYSKEITVNSIKKDSNSSSNQPDTNNNKIYNEKEHNSKPMTICTVSNINTDLSKAIDMTITENNEKGILNKIENYIERKINDQPISTKEIASRKITQILRGLNQEIELYELLHEEEIYNTLGAQKNLTLKKGKPFKNLLTE